MAAVVVMGAVTSWTWSRQEARRGAPSRAGRSGTGRTCGRRPWAARSAGSGCSHARRTWACAPPSPSVQSSPWSVLLEREAELLQQRAPLLVVLRGGDDRDVHASRAVDAVLVDLVEHDLLGQPEGVVALAVELPGREPTEVTDPGQGEREQPVEELPHPVAAQRHVGADRHALAQLELGDGLAGPGHRRLLAGDGRQVADGALDQLGVASRLADAHVDHELGQAGHLHDVGDVELAAQRGEDLLAVARLESRRALLLGRVGP